MSQYFYLVAQLPFLKFSDKPLIDSGEFLLQAAKWLSDSDFKSLAKIKINDFLSDDSDCPLIRKYKAFEKELRAGIANLRQAGASSKEQVVSEEVKKAVGAANPLEVEKQIFYLRWSFIEGLGDNNFFNLDHLKVYFLKLQILETLAEFDKDKGMAVFDALSQAKHTKGFSEERAWKKE